MSFHALSVLRCFSPLAQPLVATFFAFVVSINALSETQIAPLAGISYATSNLLKAKPSAIYAISNNLFMKFLGLLKGERTIFIEGKKK